MGSESQAPCRAFVQKVSGELLSGLVGHGSATGDVFTAVQDADVAAEKIRERLGRCLALWPLVWFRLAVKELFPQAVEHEQLGCGPEFVGLVGERAFNVG